MVVQVVVVMVKYNLVRVLVYNQHNPVCQELHMDLVIMEDDKHLGTLLTVVAVVAVVLEGPGACLAVTMVVTVVTV